MYKDVTYVTLIRDIHSLLSVEKFTRWRGISVVTKIQSERKSVQKFGVGKQGRVEEKRARGTRGSIDINGGRIGGNKIKIISPSNPLPVHSR